MWHENRGRILRLIIYMMTLVALMLVIQMDAGTDDTYKFFEDSYTERAQEAIFLTLAIGFFIASLRLQQISVLASLFSGFFMLCFVRELDALLEQNIGTGTWQVLATLVLIAMIYQARRHWSGLVHQINGHAESYSFGLFMAGFLTTFLFSRLIGSEELWMAIMEDGYRRSVKNAVEESAELLGDGLMLFSGVEFYVRYAGDKSKQAAASEPKSG